LNLISIDKDKCRQDGFCAAECPAKVILFSGKGHYPRLVPGAAAGCLRCGHCVAVCPHGALDHIDVRLADSPDIEADLKISGRQAVQFLRSRRSVRRFKGQPVERDLVRQLIEVARYAPTASNSQLLEWVVIDDRERLRRLSESVIDWMRALLEDGSGVEALPYMPWLVKAWDAGIDTILWNTPCVIVAMAPAEDRNGMVNLSLALSYLELIATTYGLGTCWAGLLQMALGAVPEIKAVAGIPADYPNHYPMMLGYAAVRYHRLPERRAPRIVWK
jgi:nitroreductase/NAD-dependent dihydropyrimidine dehydrogenase PreA subunit